MKLIELHILQSFPVTCLNRDDVGSPKSAIFGGATRARISSQSLKRAIRLTARERSPRFQGMRSRFLAQPFADALTSAGAPAETVAGYAKALCEVFSTVDPKKADQVTTAVYLSPAEIQSLATAVVAGQTPASAALKVQRNDAADIALFGRMVANNPQLNVEGAAMFSHALSTHATSNEVDFFSAVDDRKADADDAGAGMIGTLEYNSATYYRYAAVNLDLFADARHLGAVPLEDRRAILRSFLEAVLIAVPGARRNSMNGATLPVEVLGICKDRGQPLQLINAFEEPVAARGKGLAQPSIARLKEHLASVERIWGPQGTQVWLTQVGLPSFLDQLVACHG